jgi:hypothetical protein
MLTAPSSPIFANEVVVSIRFYIIFRDSYHDFSLNFFTSVLKDLLAMLLIQTLLLLLSNCNLELSVDVLHSHLLLPQLRDLGIKLFHVH